MVTQVAAALNVVLLNEYNEYNTYSVTLIVLGAH